MKFEIFIEAFLQTSSLFDGRSSCRHLLVHRQSTLPCSISTSDHVRIERRQHGTVAISFQYRLVKELNCINLLLSTYLWRSNLLIHDGLLDMGRLATRARLARSPRRQPTARMGRHRKDHGRSLPRNRLDKRRNQ